MRSRKEDEIEYLEYEEYDSDDLENELEKDELKEKVEDLILEEFVMNEL